MKSFLLRAGAFLLALALFGPAQAQNTMVRVHTTQGLIDIRLLDGEAPITVANFLAYVRGGDYTDVMFHRSAWLTNPVAPFVIQGGGYRWPATGNIVSVTSRGTIPDEVSPSRSNVRGAVAMALSGPNTATSQWYINMRNNTNLDTSYTVFGRVTTPGMVAADRISNLPRVNGGSPFGELPVVDLFGVNIERNNVVLMTEVRELPNVTASDRIFNYLEATYPQFLAPQKATTGVLAGYTYRYYAGSNAYVGTKDGVVWYVVPGINTLASPNSLDSMANLLAAAQAAGY